MDNNPQNPINQPANPPPPDEAPWLKHTSNEKPLAPTVAETPKAPTPIPVSPPAVVTPTENAKPSPPPPLPKPVAPPEPTEKINKPLEPSKVMGWIKGLAVVAVGIIICGALLLIFWPRLTGESLSNTNIQPTVQEPIVVPTEPVIEVPTMQATSSTNATSTDIVATTTPTILIPYEGQTITQKNLGDTADFFLHDQIIYSDPKNLNRSYEIEVIDFTDSRCPKDAVCVWAGERGVRLKITDKQNGNSQEIYLGVMRANSVKIMGLTFTLLEIEDGKGGTYAQIKVE
ncbi:MAG: hypothetical protein ABIB04_05020 [Patescibacteria group bacterium]